MMLNIMGDTNDRSAATQLRLQNLARDAERPERDGSSARAPASAAGPAA